ncbi:MAG: hypothetical protein KDC12_10015 [Flavobacteriales bacterium]|nr:hypothetical protein [Flavobacteriales bacterium]
MLISRIFVRVLGLTLVLFLVAPLHAQQNNFLQFSGHARTWSFTTINNGSTDDYYASALAARLRAATRPVKGISFEVEGSAFTSILPFSPDLEYLKDSRFEKQLFSTTNGTTTAQGGMITRLLARYSSKKVTLIIGRQELKTPLVQPHDGRMDEKLLEGVTFKWIPDSLWTIHVGWYWGATPRSSWNWQSVEHAIGQYGQGKTPWGTSGKYAGNTSSTGLGYFSIGRHKAKWNIDLHNYFLENISHTALLETTYGVQRYGKLMVIQQFQIGNGGNADTLLQYHTAGDQATAFSLLMGQKWSNWTLELIGTYIGGKGRYLFPRELSFDPFYATTTRFPIEGLGHVMQGGLRAVWKYKNTSVKAQYVFSKNPEVTDYEHSKTGLPTSHVLLADARTKWTFSGVRFQTRLIYLYTRATEATVGFRNKSNFHHMALGLAIQF